MAKTYVLTFVKGETVTEISRHESQAIAKKMQKKYEADIRFFGGKIQFRTLQGLQNVKILNK
jgi:hypothetical protein